MISNHVVLFSGMRYSKRLRSLLKKHRKNWRIWKHCCLRVPSRIRYRFMDWTCFLHLSIYHSELFKSPDSKSLEVVPCSCMLLVRIMMPHAYQIRGRHLFHISDWLTMISQVCCTWDFRIPLSIIFSLLTVLLIYPILTQGDEMSIFNYFCFDLTYIEL